MPERTYHGLILGGALECWPAATVARSRSGSRGVRSIEGPMNDSQLLETAIGGDQAAFAELVQAHRRPLQAHCYRMLGSLQDAEDAVQETLLLAWRSLSSFQGRSSLRSWLYSIATNVCLRAIERRPSR